MIAIAAPLYLKNLNGHPLMMKDIGDNIRTIIILLSDLIFPDSFPDYGFTKRVL